MVIECFEKFTDKFYHNSQISPPLESFRAFLKILKQCDTSRIIRAPVYMEEVNVITNNDTIDEVPQISSSIRHQ